VGGGGPHICLVVQEMECVIGCSGCFETLHESVNAMYKHT
jgi:hypothetical protein